MFSGSPAGLFPSQCGLQADVSPEYRHVGAAAAARRSSCTKRRMLYARFFSPIRARARTSPMLRTSVPPMSLLWAPNTCSTRARTFERVVLPRFPKALNTRRQRTAPAYTRFRLRFFGESPGTCEISACRLRSIAWV